MTARTTKADVSRAVLEGITFGLADSLDLVRAIPGVSPPKEIRVTGGGAKSAFWRKLMADVFEAEIAVTTSTEGPAFGAALLAAVGAGAFRTVEEACDALVHVTQRVAPDATTAARYREIHAVYRTLYPALRESMHALARVE
jgi:xylulokinase